MIKMKLRLVMLVAVGIVSIASTPAFAAFYNVGGTDVMIDGYIRQEFSYNYNNESPVNMEGLQSAYSILYTDMAAEFGRNVEVRGIFRLWADMAYTLNSGDSHWDTYFKGSRDELQVFDEFDDIVRELYVTYTAAKFQFRVGRQQIGWGESDGLRLMDVINPLDLRRGPFYDTQGYSEVRIPKWLVKAEYYPEAFGNINNIALQLIWNPGDIQEQQHLQLPLFVDAHLAPDARVMPNTAGAWAVETAVGHELPFAFTYDRRTDALRNSEFGARLSFGWGETYLTLNFWHGIAHESLFDFSYIGPHPLGRTIPVAFDAAGNPIAFENMAVHADLVYPRVTYAGITANREVALVSQWLGMATNPVIRFEALYSFDQNMNSNKVIVDLNTGMPSDVFEIIETDQIRYMVGFDWPIRIKWLNPKKNIFISGQFFHFYTVDMPTPDQFGNETDIVPDSSPYHSWTFDRNQTYGSLLLRTEYMNERLVPSVLFVQDMGTGAHWAVTEIGYKIGDHWRPSLRWLYVDGAYQESFGVYRRRDEVTLRIQYQF